ncbi:MAG: hypothetical protein RR047_02580 [Bacilli bacterium]
MKKIGLLLCCLLMVTGCSIVNINNQSIEGIIKTIFSTKTSLANNTFSGYKYYLPKGVKALEVNDLNAVLLDNYNYYYLYIDTVAYYHKTKEVYEVQTDSYYSQSLNYNDKTGYIEINKVGDKYFIETMFNYSKIEAYVKEKDIENALINIGVILTSVTYNDKVLETLVGENVLNYKEEHMNIFKPKREESEFLQIYKEYGTYSDKLGELPDPDQIQIEEEIK